MAIVATVAVGGINIFYGEMVSPATYQFAAQSQCLDSDLSSLMEKGTCEVGNEFYNDFCLNDISVVEFQCSPICEGTVFNCQESGFSGCEDGACF